MISPSKLGASDCMETPSVFKVNIGANPYQDESISDKNEQRLSKSGHKKAYVMADFGYSKNQIASEKSFGSSD